jgi:hypothetical protein
MLTHCGALQASTAGRGQRLSTAGVPSALGAGGAGPALTPPSRTRRPSSSSRSCHTAFRCLPAAGAARPLPTPPPPPPPSPPSLSPPLPSPRSPLVAPLLPLSLLSSSSSLPSLLPSSPLPLPLPSSLPRPPLAPSAAPAAAPRPPCSRPSSPGRRRGSGAAARPGEGRSSSVSSTPAPARRMATTRHPSRSATLSRRRLRSMWPHLLPQGGRQAMPSQGVCCREDGAARMGPAHSGAALGPSRRASRAQARRARQGKNSTSRHP